MENLSRSSLAYMLVTSAADRFVSPPAFVSLDELPEPLSDWRTSEL